LDDQIGEERWAGHAARMGEMKKISTTFDGKREERDNSLEDNH
jgi:hypothetical protein